MINALAKRSTYILYIDVIKFIPKTFLGICKVLGKDGQLSRIGNEKYVLRLTGTRLQYRRYPQCDSQDHIFESKLRQYIRKTKRD